MPCQPFLPVRLSASTPPASAVSPMRVVQFAISEQPRIGGHPRSVELQFQAAVEKGPEWPMVRFTLRVPHPSHPPAPSSQ